MKQYLLIFTLLLGTIYSKAQTLYVTSGGSVVAQNTAVDIAGNAAVTSGSTALVGATVSISSNFVTGQDVLGLNGAATGGITSSYNATTGILTLSGSASAADYQTTLRKVTYTNTSATPATAARVITFSLNAALPFTGNGHYYEFIPGINIAWTVANAAANARTYFGLHGYLATITSSQENTFVYSKINGSGWLGASDAASEGVWKWVCGPENGTQFWQGTWNAGSVVGGMYNNWDVNQPDNWNTENYLHYYNGDHWNDFPNAASGIAGYMVEYGGMPGDPVPHISDNVMVDFAPLVKNLSVTSGTNIKWYDAASGGNLLASTTPLVNGNHYYASQTVNGVESSARLDITAIVNPPPQGSLSANGPLCATGTGTLTWTKTAGTGPYTVVYNDGTANRTASGVTSGTPFNVFSNPVTSNTTYTLVSVQDANCARSAGFTGGTATITVAPLPSAPAAGTQTPAQTQIVWNWNTVSGATGYKWGTTDVYSTATDMGTALTNTETGLTCNTSYSRYIWAYNASGCISTPSTLNQSTASCGIPCGSSITIDHVVSGGVAPVDKTVTYGIVTGLAGEPAKCWITRNLGASAQATVENWYDEAPAGWYFQFNRKQGYQYTTARTPGSAWNATNDNLSATWEAAKDPCTLELGTGWRIPTNTEWDNVLVGGNWCGAGQGGPFNTALAIHWAGLLNNEDGSLQARGTEGVYWSSVQQSDIFGWFLQSDENSCLMIDTGKAFGFPIRCIRDN